MGVGGEFGIGMAIVTETWSKEMRAKATSVVALGWQFGVLVASLLPAFIVPHFGWRAVFLFGLIPALLAVYVRKSLSEPKIWEQKQRYKKELLQKEATGKLTTTEAEQLKHIKNSHFESYLPIKSNNYNNRSHYYVVYPKLRILRNLHMDAHYFSK